MKLLKLITQFLLMGFGLVLGLFTIGYLGMNQLWGVEQAVTFVKTHPLFFIGVRLVLYLTLFYSYHKLKQHYPAARFKRANVVIVGMIVLIELANLLNGLQR